jgi:catalase
MPKIVSTRVGPIRSADGDETTAEFSVLTSSSVLFDAVMVAGGEDSMAALRADPRVLEFVNEAFKHCKTVAATGAGVEVLKAARVVPTADGVVVGEDRKASQVGDELVEAMHAHRHWSRELSPPPPA